MGEASHCLGLRLRIWLFNKFWLSYKVTKPTMNSKEMPSLLLFLYQWEGLSWHEIIWSGLGNATTGRTQKLTQKVMHLISNGLWGEKGNTLGACYTLDLGINNCVTAL